MFYETNILSNLYFNINVAIILIKPKMWITQKKLHGPRATKLCLI